MVQLFKLYLIPCFLNMDSLVSGIIAVWIVISLFQEMLSWFVVMLFLFTNEILYSNTAKSFSHLFCTKIVTIRPYPWRIYNWQNPSKGYFIFLFFINASSLSATESVINLDCHAFCNINRTFKITTLKSPIFLRLHNISKKAGCWKPLHNLF